MWHRSGSETLMRCLHCFPIVAVVAAPCGPAQLSPNDEVQVQLHPKKETFTVGEKIQLTIEISNQSKEHLYVGRDAAVLYTWLHYLDLECSNRRGKKSPKLQLSVLSIEPRDGDFDTELNRLWVLLKPGAKHILEVEFHPGFFAFLNKPGRYQLIGTYYSYSMDIQGVANPLRGHLDEIRKLPHQAWAGRTPTNSIVVEIVKKTTPTK